MWQRLFKYEESDLVDAPLKIIFTNCTLSVPFFDHPIGTKFTKIQLDFWRGACIMYTESGYTTYKMNLNFVKG